MKSFDKLFLSEYLIKAAFQKQAFGAAIMKSIPSLAKGFPGLMKPLASKVLASPAAKAVGGLDDAMARAAPSLEAQLFKGVPAVQRVQQRVAQGLPARPGAAGLVDETPAKLIQRSSGSYTPRQPILTNVPDAAPAALAAVAPAAAAAMPTGLALARQGAGQMLAGTGQALRGGLNSLVSAGTRATNAAGRGLKAVGTSVANVAANPKVQAGAIGLGAGALGSYATNKAMGVGATPQSPAAPAQAATPAAPAQAASPTAPAQANPAYPSADALADAEGIPTAPAAPAAPASVPAAAAQAAYDQQLAADEATAQEDAAMVNEPDYNQIFKRYMGSDYRGDSSLDRAKMQYLQSLHGQGRDLNASNIYNKSYGYGNW